MKRKTIDDAVSPDGLSDELHDRLGRIANTMNDEGIQVDSEGVARLAIAIGARILAKTWKPDEPWKK